MAQLPRPSSTLPLFCRAGRANPHRRVSPRRCEGEESLPHYSKRPLGPSILNAIHLKLKALAVTTVPSRHRRRRDRNARAAGFSDGHSVPIYSPCHRCLLYLRAELVTPSKSEAARYGLMLAEQMGDDFIRASLLKLVRAWLAAAKEIEKAANNVLVEIAAGP